MQIRTPAVAGMFYPGEKNELQKNIHDCFLHNFGSGHLPPSNSSEKIFGIISPHAGYSYSGPIASQSYYSISSMSPELVIIIGPNHWGIGSNIATMKDCNWETPLGLVEVDTDAAVELNSIAKSVEIDFFSHVKDHSLEVQIPFLQEVFLNKFKILPIILIDQSFDVAEEIGNAISIIAKTKKTMIVGSSDFTHYEQNEFAHRQDKALIEPIINLDVKQFYDVLKEKKVSACGYGAIASTMIACKKLGASKGKLIKYATSGDVTGETDSVVGYSAICFI